MKTSQLFGAALDWAVATLEQERNGSKILPYSTDWAHAGPIIDREKIDIVRGRDLYFPQGNEKGEYYEPLWIAGRMQGQTQLIAAMRCYVASKMGDDIEVPEVLMGKHC
jgi:hypothetical protein